MAKKAMVHQHAPLNWIAAQFLKSVEQARHNRQPYDHWILSDALPDDAIASIVSLPFSPSPDLIFDGRREVNNSVRVFFSPENQRKFSVCAAVVDALTSPEIVSALEEITGAKISQGQLRVEYCQDTDGFWLEPHVDIAAKLFTMLIYLSDEPELRDAGTDIYDASPEHKCVDTIAYARNRGMIFIPGANTWHGFSKRPIRGVRRSIIVNYVSPDWRSVSELAY